MKKLVINREDLKHNINKIREIANEGKALDGKSNVKIIGVVKGNGYGLCLVPFANYLVMNGIGFLAVSTVEEALALRNAKVKAKILMLSATASKRDIDVMVQNNIIITIGSKEDLIVAEKVAQKRDVKIKAHLKIDTGFGRYGFCYDKKEELVDLLKNLENIEIEGTFSHFSLAFYKKDKYSKVQFNRFMEVVDYLKQNGINTGMLHICNSSGFLKYKDMRLDAVRIGSAFLGRLAIPNIYGLKKIGYLRTNITEIKMLPKGYNIGYSNSYKTKKETKVAIIPCGYKDGFNVREQRDMFRKRDKLRYIIRDIKDSFKDQSLYAEVTINFKDSKKCKVLGRIGMYHVAIDVTGLDAKVGDRVKLNVSPMFVESKIRREYELCKDKNNT